MIELKNISKRFKDNTVLTNNSFRSEKGEAIGIIGRSGSGKSVLIKIIAGLLKPTSGTVKIQGQIGFSPQNNSLYPNLTVKENLDYFATLYDMKDKRKLNQYIQDLQLEPYRNKLVSKISGGTKKRVDIACALLNDPDILLLDEPFVGLDNVLISQLSIILKKIISKGTTLIISSHHIDEILPLCQRYLLVKEGNLHELKKEKLKEVLI